MSYHEQTLYSDKRERRDGSTFAIVRRVYEDGSADIVGGYWRWPYEGGPYFDRTYPDSDLTDRQQERLSALRQDGERP